MTQSSTSTSPQDPSAGSYFVHPTSVVDSGAEIGPGTKVWHFSHVMGSARIGAKCTLSQNVFVGAHVRIGSNVKIQNNVSVYECVSLEDDVFVGPSVVFTNVTRPRSAFPQDRSVGFSKTVVKKGATLGANSTIVCGITLHEHSFVGAGAVVTKDVPAFALVTGVPAKVVGYVGLDGNRLNFDSLDSAEDSRGNTYQKDSSGRVRIVKYGNA